MLHSIMKSRIISAITNARPKAKFVSVNVASCIMNIYNVDGTTETEPAGFVDEDTLSKFRMLLDIQVFEKLHIDIEGKQVVIYGDNKRILL